MVAVTFASGDQTFSSGTEYSVYIYPQNAAGVSKDYVDSQDTLLQDQIDVNKTDIADKADKTYVDSQDALKVSKSGDHHDW